MQELFHLPITKPDISNDEHTGSSNEEQSDTEYDEQLASYEKQPRTFGKPESLKRKLPVKKENGVWQRGEVLEDEKNLEIKALESHFDTQNDGNTGEEEIIKKKKKIPFSKLPKKERKKLLTEKKIRIVELSESIIEDPEHSLSKMQHLANISHDIDPVARHLALLSTSQVFKDILPDYRIREVTSDEENKMSKEVKKAVRYERLLLKAYKTFLMLLIEKHNETRSKIKQQKKEDANNGSNMRELFIITKCLCILLDKAHTFNYRKELIQSIVLLLDVNSEDIRKMALFSLTKMFKADIAGDVSLETVRMISKIIKKKKGKAYPEVMSCYLRLPLSRKILQSEVKGGKYKGKKQLLREKKKKHALTKYQEATIRKDLKQADARVSLEHQKRAQTAMITLVFTNYFQILKDVNADPILLRHMFKGLSKFSKLVNIELVLDLVDCLKNVCEHVKATEDVLLCIQCALQIFEDHEGSIVTDLHEFYSHLYCVLWDFIDPDNYKNIPSLLSTIYLLFGNPRATGKRGISLKRIASFVRRLAMIAVYLPTNASLGILHQIHWFLTRYDRLSQLLEPEYSTNAIYLPGINDPDRANPFGSTAWELMFLKSSYHPFLSSYPNYLCDRDNNKIPHKLDRMSPEDMMSAYDHTKGGFNPSIPPPKKRKIKNKQITN